MFPISRPGPTGLRLLASCLAVACVLFSAGTGVAYALDDEMVIALRSTYGPSGEVFARAQLDGSRLVNFTSQARAESLSPDGSRVVWRAGNSLRMATRDGVELPPIYTAPTGTSVGPPTFHPDGTQVAFLCGSAICAINIDGTNYRQITGAWLSAGHPDLAYSPDGRFLAVASSRTPTGAADTGLRIYRVAADGSGASAISPLGKVLYAAMEPDYGRNGRVSFVGYPPQKGGGDPTGSMTTGEIYTVNDNGTDLRRLTTDTISVFSPRWTTDGRIGYTTGQHYTSTNGFQWVEIRSMNPDGTDVRTVHRRAATGTPLQEPWLANYRELSDFVDYGDYLAMRHRPNLAFDEGEKWRPVNIESFAKEMHPDFPGTPYNEVCDELVGCSGLTATSTLNQFPTDRSYIRLGWRPGLGDATPESYRSPNASCVVGSVLDCDTGPAASIYYQATTRSAGYNYIDYWWFYRFNQTPGGVADHQGDWEGLTVAPSLSVPGTFDFASFAQHNTRSTYLRGLLECDAGGVASCGLDDSSRRGQRVWGFPAGGTHATYPSRCGNACWQESGVVPETDHGGELNWGRNSGDRTDGALVEFPRSPGWSVPSAGSWTDWPGRWGGTGQHGDDSPQSPGNQRRFKCPWEGNPQDQTACSARRASASPAAVARSCRSWFGSSIAAAACSPSVLADAVAGGSLAGDGSLKLAVRGRRSRAASADGIAQLAAAPLRTRDTLIVSGTASSDTVLRVRFKEGSRLYTAALELGRIKRGERAVITARPAGSRVRVTLRIDRRAQRTTVVTGRTRH